MPDVAHEDALAVLQALRQAGFVAYFAGGCVRDLLMGRQAKDYDVATDAAPQQVRGLFKNTQAVGAAFGVILVRQARSTIEVATFRTDLEYRDGRRPEGVKFATAEEDANRRDFTINGLFLDPVENRIIDFVGGQADLQARRLRAIGNADRRFAEDHLRLLRAVRFASRLDFEIEAATAEAITTHATELKRISPERIAEELRKMLTPATRDRAFQLLHRFGLIAVLMRFLPEKTSDRLKPPVPIFLSLNPGKAVAFGAALAALVLDFRMNAAEAAGDPRDWFSASEIKRSVLAMRQTLKISNDELNEMSWSMSFVQLLADETPRVAALKRFLNQPHAEDAMQLMAAVASCGMMNDRIGVLMQTLDHYRQTEFAPLPLVTGDDLTTAGASPGPKFKLALDAAYDAQLEGTITTKQQAMDVAMKVVQ
jgi:poly(A) polymerase